MWDRVTETICRSLFKLEVGCRTLRSPVSYKSRYHNIQTDTVKFLGFRNQCSASGDNQVLINQKAHDIFESSFVPPRKFPYDHCLDLMESSEKIRSLLWSSSVSSPDRSSSCSSSPELTSNSSTSSRPQGRDTSKRDRLAERQRSKVDTIQSQNIQNISESLISISKHFEESMTHMKAVTKIDSKRKAMQCYIKFLPKNDIRRKELLEALNELCK